MASLSQRTLSEEVRSYGSQQVSNDCLRGWRLKSSCVIHHGILTELSLRNSDDMSLDDKKHKERQSSIGPH